jgi:hypothetical protein
VYQRADLKLECPLLVPTTTMEISQLLESFIPNAKKEENVFEAVNCTLVLYPTQEKVRLFTADP